MPVSTPSVRIPAALPATRSCRLSPTITVLPGASLSLQSHFHRSEHWIIVEGTAQVTLDGDVSVMTENESIYIPVGAKHRIENPGRIPMVFIEVQTGPYVGEDDIIRHEDRYART